MVAVVSFLCPWRAVTELLRAVNGFHRLPRRDVELTLSGACRVGMGVEGRNDVNAINHPMNHSCHIPFLGGIPNLSQFHTPLMGDGKFIGSTLIGAYGPAFCTSHPDPISLANGKPTAQICRGGKCQVGL